MTDDTTMEDAAPRQQVPDDGDDIMDDTTVPNSRGSNHTSQTDPDALEQQGVSAELDKLPNAEEQDAHAAGMRQRLQRSSKDKAMALSLLQQEEKQAKQSSVYYAAEYPTSQQRPRKRARTEDDDESNGRSTIKDNYKSVSHKARYQVTIADYIVFYVAKSAVGTIDKYYGDVEGIIDKPCQPKDQHRIFYRTTTLDTIRYAQDNGFLVYISGRVVPDLSQPDEKEARSIFGPIVDWYYSIDTEQLTSDIYAIDMQQSREQFNDRHHLLLRDPHPFYVDAMNDSMTKFMRMLGTITAFLGQVINDPSEQSLEEQLENLARTLDRLHFAKPLPTTPQSADAYDLITEDKYFEAFLEITNDVITGDRSWLKEMPWYREGFLARCEALQGKRLRLTEGDVMDLDDTDTSEEDEGKDKDYREGQMDAEYDDDEKPKKGRRIRATKPQDEEVEAPQASGKKQNAPRAPDVDLDCETILKDITDDLKKKAIQRCVELRQEEMSGRKSGGYKWALHTTLGHIEHDPKKNLDLLFDHPDVFFPKGVPLDALHLQGQGTRKKAKKSAKEQDEQTLNEIFALKHAFVPESKLSTKNSNRTNYSKFTISRKNKSTKTVDVGDYVGVKPDSARGKSFIIGMVEELFFDHKTKQDMVSISELIRLDHEVDTMKSKYVHYDKDGFPDDRELFLPLKKEAKTVSHPLSRVAQRIFVVFVKSREQFLELFGRSKRMDVFFVARMMDKKMQVYPLPKESYDETIRISTKYPKICQRVLSIEVPTMDLYAGAGGLSLGFQFAGAQVKYTAEVGKDATATLEANNDKYFGGKMKVLTEDVDTLIAAMLARHALFMRYRMLHGLSTDEDELKRNDELYKLLPEDKIEKTVTGMELTKDRYSFQFKVKTGDTKKFMTLEELLESNDTKLLAEVIDFFARTTNWPIPGKIEVLIGGPPCQGFSKLNNTRDKLRFVFDRFAPGGSGKNNCLLLTFLKFVKFLRPKYVAFENVLGLLDVADGQAFRYLLHFFEHEVNYRFDISIHDAAQDGSPQVRTRVLFMASRKDVLPHKHPEQTHSIFKKTFAIANASAEEARKKILSNVPASAKPYIKSMPDYDSGLYPRMTVLDVISDLIEFDLDDRIKPVTDEELKKKKANAYKKAIKEGKTEEQAQARAEASAAGCYARPCGFTTAVKYKNDRPETATQAYFREEGRTTTATDHEAKGFRPRIIEFIRKVPRCGGAFYAHTGWAYVKDNMMKTHMGTFSYRNGGALIFARPYYDSCFNAIVTHPDAHSQGVMHPSQDRVFSVLEMKRGQTFPDGYVLKSNSTPNKYKLVGNAVSVKMAESVGRTVMKVVRKQRLLEMTPEDVKAFEQQQEDDLEETLATFKELREAETDRDTLMKQIEQREVETNKVVEELPKDKWYLNVEDTLWFLPYSKLKEIMDYVKAEVARWRKKKKLRQAAEFDPEDDNGWDYELAQPELPANGEEANVAEGASSESSEVVEEEQEEVEEADQDDAIDQEDDDEQEEEDQDVEEDEVLAPSPYDDGDDVME